MGQKVNPISWRLIKSLNWQSRWFSKRHYRQWLLEDIKIRQEIENKLGQIAAIASVEIERNRDQTILNISTGKPGVLIGRTGQGITELAKFLQSKFPDNKFKINIIEIKNPNLSARLVARNIAYPITKRIAYRRVVKQAIAKVMEAGADGVKVMASGRLGGVEIARREKFSAGSIPLGTIKANIDFAAIDAFTTFGIIGVKVWIYLRGEENVNSKKIKTS